MLQRSAPSFYGKQTVLLGRNKVLLEDVPVGKVFVLDGRNYQSSVNRKPYSAVSVDTAFRFSDTWYRRVALLESQELTPNMPFGVANVNNRTKQFRETDHVSILEIICRGDA